MFERRTRDITSLVAFLALCLAVSGLGGIATSSSVGTWYQTLIKPPFNPPDWVFAPVWTVLYVMIAVAGWRVWRKASVGAAKKALAAYGVQLALNLGWSVLFFGAQQVGWALLEIIFLNAAIAATWWLFRPIDKVAALLFVPYGLWVAFATALNASILILNM
jgi:translocator protein